MSNLSADILDLLAEKAPKLREAGVTSFEVEGVRVELAPKDPTPERRSKGEQRPDIGDPLEDPDTFGGSVPGFPKLREVDER